jgi:hypothetical protein
MRDRWGVIAVLTAWLVIKFIAMPLVATRSDHISNHPGAWTYVITAAIVYGLYKGWHGAWVFAVLMEGFFLALFLLAVAPGPVDAGEATMMILQAALLALLGWPSLRAHVGAAGNVSTARL